MHLSIVEIFKRHKERERKKKDLRKQQNAQKHMATFAINEKRINKWRQNSLWNIPFYKWSKQNKCKNQINLQQL